MPLFVWMRHQIVAGKVRVNFNTLKVFSVSNDFLFSIENKKSENIKAKNFLDITIINNNNLIEFDWYHKPTYSGRYLNFLSSHPLSQKRDIIIGMIDRVFLLSDPKYHQKNVEHITKKMIIRLI